MYFTDDDSKQDDENQQRIKDAQRKLKQWKDQRAFDLDESQKQSDQDKPLQDYEEIQLQMKDEGKEGNFDSPQGPKNPYEEGNETRKSKSDYKSHYNQFYGSEDAGHHTKGIRGTFLGVFIPCLQNILSVVIFLRLSPIVGEAGIFHTLILLAFAKVTTLLTILSMNAIATNGKIRTGGLYYLASRSLGPTSGAVIGLLYYLATTFSAGMSIIGSVEAIVISVGLNFGPPAFSYRFFSIIILGIMIILKLLFSRHLNAVSLAFIIFVFISLFCLVIGLFSAGKRHESIEEILPGITGLSGLNFKNNWNHEYEKNTMSMLYALFFNAATGILTATNLSDNLADPVKSIPRGTLAAHNFSSALYLIMIFLLGCVGTRVALREVEVVVAAVVAWPASWIVYIGIILSSNGAALNNFSNAPAIIKAITDDDLLPWIFNFLKGDYRKSVLFTAGLIVITFLFGNLDAVAPLVTIFFLLCYGGINITCFLQDWLGSPNWRPKWKYYHKLSSFFGVILCVASMIVISWWASLSCIFASLVVYAYFEKKSQEKNWGDGVEGMRQERARNALLKIDKNKDHIKNWRPHYLALGYVNEKGKISSPGIFKLLHQLRKGTGLAIYGCVIKGDYTEEAYAEAAQKEKDLDDYLKKNKFNVFSKVIVSQNIENGMIYLLQSSGLGGLEPNTILLSWPNSWENDELKTKRFVNLVQNAKTCGHLLTILKPQKNFDNDIKHKGCMDIWSFNFEKGMLLLIAQILKKNSHWKRCNVRLFVVTSLPMTESETMKRVTREYLDRYRLFSGDIYIEIVHANPSTTQQFTSQLTDTLQKKEKVFQQAVAQGNKDFEYGTLPSLMKLKALQEKENRAIKEFKKKHTLTSYELDDSDEVIKTASEINQMIREKSSNDISSIVITNLPPLIKDQNASQYLGFCQKMTEGIDRVLFIQNSSKEVLTQYS